MASKLLSTWDQGRSWQFDYHLDTERVIPDPGKVISVTGTPEAVQATMAALIAAGGKELAPGVALTDAKAYLPDPEYILNLRFGKVDGAGRELTLANAKALADEEVAARVGVLNATAVEISQ